MVLNAYDVKVCVWKMIQLSTKTCVNVSKRHPYITSCLFFLFLLYICCPLFFWILIYSLPPAVSAWVVLTIRDGRRCKEERENEREKEREQKEREGGGKIGKKAVFAEEGKRNGKERIKKAYSRVHSVRRRKAKEIECGNDPYAKRNTGEVEDEDEDEDYNALFSTDPDRDGVDKKPLFEESPKEIREVGATGFGAGAAADISINSEILRNPEVVRSLKLLKDEEDARDEANKAMDVNIAEAERNKRLESLIARRRSKRVPSQHVKRSLMNNDATMPPIVIPKVSTWCSPSKSVAPFSPGPGSAPSLLGPTRNPFDLPYDPQEEKPDLTGDSFQQEFASGHNRDFTFCRHESFSLGPSLPMDFFEDRDDASSIDDFGFRRRRSSIGYQFPRPETEESDTDFGATTEAESGHEGSGHESDSCPDSKSNLDSLDSDHPDNDQIKGVIQVHENDAQTPSAEGRSGKPNTRPNALDELSLSEGSTGSSEDDRPPVCKINREAILKSLSMRRNSVSVPVIEMESNDQLQENNLSYANSALENASRLKQQYFADKPQKRHGMTFSIASDMQVEVSELSSPPLTIGENMSYQDDASVYEGDMERNVSWEGLDSWAGSSRLSEAEDNETRPLPVYETGATRSKKCDDMIWPSSADKEKCCVISSASSAGPQATAGLRDKIIAQTTSPDCSFDEEQSLAAATEDADASSTEAVENVASNEPAQRVEGESGESSTQAATDSNDPSQERVHHPTISPKSVLQPTLSVASFEHEDHDEAQLSGAHPSSNAPPNSRSSGVQFTVGSSSNRAAESSQHAPSVPRNASVSGAKHTESFNEQQKIQANDDSSSTSLSSDAESNDTDYANEDRKTQMSNMQFKEESSSSRNVITKIQESNADEVFRGNQIDKGKMVIQESTDEHDTDTGSEDYDSEVEDDVSHERKEGAQEHGDLNDGGAK